MEISEYLQEIAHAMKPYRETYESYARLPEQGCSRQEVLQKLEDFVRQEAPRWSAGYVSGAVYHGDGSHIDFQNQAYNLNSQSNPLHFDVFPSANKFEAEIVSMTAHMLGAGQTSDEIVGAVSSGGTESILLAMKTYRDWARAVKGITEPELIVPTTAHVAFEKASQYFNIRLIRIPVGPDFRADLQATEAAITPNTIALVGSAPQFPHGIIDPIEELSELARARGLGFHTDSCLGGFVLPWAEKLGYPVPPFDFRLPGVTSMSADTHKYGYAAKGTSVVLYRGNQLRHFQYYTSTDWPGGFYMSPTLTGSRPGGLSAACWAALVSIGEKGYLDAAGRILAAAARIKDGIRSIPELKVLGDPLFVVAFASDSLDIYAVLDYMTKKGWGLNGLQRPSGVHIAITLRHTQPGVTDRFIADLKEAVEYAKTHPETQGSMGPIYGLASQVEFKIAAEEILKGILDLSYTV